MLISFIRIFKRCDLRLGEIAPLAARECGVEGDVGKSDALKACDAVVARGDHTLDLVVLALGKNDASRCAVGVEGEGGGLALIAVGESDAVAECALGLEVKRLG